MSATIVPRIVEPKQLAQVRFTDTVATTVYSPASGVIAIIRHIVIWNMDTSETNDMWVYHDEDGTTYNDTTVIYHFPATPPRTGFELSNLYIPMRNSSGNLAAGNGTVTTPILSMTVWGDELT